VNPMDAFSAPHPPPPVVDPPSPPPDPGHPPVAQRQRRVRPITPPPPNLGKRSSKPSSKVQDLVTDAAAKTGSRGKSIPGRDFAEDLAKTDAAKAKTDAEKKSNATKTAEENLLSAITELDTNDAISPTTEIWAMLAPGPPADDEPKSYEEAVARNDADEWKNAMEEELKLLGDMGTWDLINLEDAPPDTNVIGSRWVFRQKRDAAGNVT
jgi:hypothetical protein